MRIWGFDAELAAYVEAGLRARWPALEVQCLAHPPNASHPQAELWICGVSPPAALPVPTLWLGELDRAAGAVRIGDLLWRCSTPITHDTLQRSIERICAQLDG